MESHPINTCTLYEFFDFLYYFGLATYLHALDHELTNSTVSYSSKEIQHKTKEILV